jgi:predicted outer membrane repeat protein
MMLPKIVCATMLCAAAADLAQAATIIGTGTPASCTSAAVRKAVVAGGKATFNCGPAPVVIDFDRCATVSAVLSFDGNGLVTLRGTDVCDDARFFSVTTTGTLTLTGIVLSDATGTAIRNDGTTVIEGSMLIGNGTPDAPTAPVANGGAIFNNGTLTVTNSAFVENRTTGKGGAIFASTTAKMTIINTSFVGNSADSGGALYVSRGLIVNGTFVGNRAITDGGAFANARPDTVGAALRNTLIVGNVSGEPDGNCAAARPEGAAAVIVDGGGNFQYPGTGCGATISSVDPRVLPAGYYGGTTVVTPLAPGSPVGDAGVPVLCQPDDQRGHPRNRVSSGGFTICSPGAVELSASDVDPRQTAIEYYYPARNHYFVTPLAAEIQALDAGRFPGWTRTGDTIPVLVDTGQQILATSPVCRFYGLPAAGLDSHFFSATPLECQQVIDRFPGAWLLETTSLFSMHLPADSGACAPGTDPVFRLFNNRTDVNHRYTTSLATRSQMIAEGWIPEGVGAGGVWCALH